MLNGEGEPVWLTPHQRDSQPEGRKERERDTETEKFCSLLTVHEAPDKSIVHFFERFSPECKTQVTATLRLQPLFLLNGFLQLQL